MQVIIPDGGQRHPLCLRSEVRAYRSSADRNRAAALFRRGGHRVTPFLEVNGPAVQISLWAYGPAVPSFAFGRWNDMTPGQGGRS